MDAGRTTRWATAASALLALAVATLGAVVIRRGDTGGLDPWRTVIVAWAVAPFALPCWVAHRPARAADRLPALWFAVPIGAVASVFSYLALLPSLLLLLAAAVRASRGVFGAEGAGGAATGGALLFAGGWIAGFRALFASADARCGGIPGGSTCTSDVVTAPEAVIALALLATGVVLAAWLAGRRVRSA